MILNEVFTQVIFVATESRAQTEILIHLVLAHHVLLFHFDWCESFDVALWPPV